MELLELLEVITLGFPAGRIQA